MPLPRAMETVRPMLFDLDEDMAYFAAASRTPLTRRSQEVGVRAMAKKMREPWAMGSDGIDEKLREAFAKLVNCTSDDVAICPSTSFALSTAARALEATLQEGDVALILDEQMSSNTYPWQRLQTSAGLQLQAVPYPEDSNWTDALLAAMYAVREEGHHLAFVAIPIVLWTDCSGPVDLEQISEACRSPWNEEELPAALIVDATQSLGALPVDVQETPVDFLAASVHKWLFGPYGVSLLYVNRRWWEDPNTQPLVEDEHCRLHMANGDEEVPFDITLPGYPLETKTGARRLDMGGRPNPILLPMALEGLKQVLEWEVDELCDFCCRIATRLQNELQGYMELWVAPSRGPHFLGIGPGPKDNCNTEEEVRGWVVDCTNWLKKRNVFVTGKLKVVRIAPHIYTTEKDCDALLRGMETFLQYWRGDL